MEETNSLKDRIRDGCISKTLGVASVERYNERTI